MGLGNWPALLWGYPFSQGNLPSGLWIRRTTSLCIFRPHWTPKDGSTPIWPFTACSPWSEARQLHKDARLCLPHLADAPTTRMVTAPLTPHSTYVAGGLSNDLGDERFGQVSPCLFCTWFGGTRRLTLGIPVDSSHGKAREGPWQESVGLSSGHLSKAGINLKSLNLGWSLYH